MTLKSIHKLQEQCLMLKSNNLNQQRDFLATRREELLTAKDYQNRFERAKNHFLNKKILVIGGSGSIGSSFIYEIADFNPKSLHIIDPNENGLTNVVRNLRSSDTKASKLDVITSPLDFGSKITEQFILENGPYDYVYNFAAIKHVRSEKDIYSLMQMFDTNVIKHAKFLEFLNKNNLSNGYFAVSTDKAANPVSLMGASKKLMELVLQCKHLDSEVNLDTSTTRFANVAFSNGSLLQSFSTRYEKKEPIPAPMDIKRYFVSHAEAAQICILASIDIDSGDILVPKINSNFEIYPILDVAKNFIKSKKLEPVLVETKDDAYKILNNSKNNYPILTTRPDTSGEKEFEEFIGNNETTKSTEYINFDIINKTKFDSGKLIDFIESFETMTQGKTKISKKKLVENIQEIISSFNHIDTGISLDSRM